MNTTTLAGLLHYISRNSLMRAALYMLLVAALVLVVEIVIWSTAKIANLNLHDDIAAERNRLYMQDQMQRLDAHLRKTLPSVESIERKYKSSYSQSDVMKQLSGLVREHHLRMHSQSIAELANGDGNSSVNSIELSLSGHYVDIRRMLGKLPGMDAWVEVADIRLERANGSNVLAQVRLFLIREPAQ